MKTLDALARYAAPATPDRPLERILRWLAELDEALRTIDPTLEPIVDAAMRLDIRRFFFMLEGAYRLYRDRYGDEGEALSDRAEAMEDLLGAVDYRRAMLETAERVKAPKKTRLFLREARDKAEKKLRKRLRKDWSPGADGKIPGVAALVEATCALPWDDAATDRRYLCDQIAGELEKIQDDELDMDELEEGVHELRRDIRWFPIYLFALEGFAALDDGLNPIPELEPLLGSEAASSKYAALPPSPREPDPVRVSRSLFIKNTLYIDELGDLKDEGQAVEGLARALKKSGVKKKAYRALEEALELLDHEPGHMHFIHERSAVIYDEIKRTRIYALLAQPFRSAMD